MKAFTVSFVYSRSTQTSANGVLTEKVNNSLRCIAVYGRNEDEAFGAAYRLTKNEFNKEEGWALSMTATIEITDFLNSLKDEADGKESY